MKDGDQRPEGPAKGVRLKNGRRQVVIKMDQDQFEEVHALAVSKKTSVAEQIRLLIEWGLEAVE